MAPIHKLLSRKFQPLSVEETASLSLWAALFSMTFEFADIETKTTYQITRNEFRESLKIPENMRIFLGLYKGSGFQLTCQHLSRFEITMHADQRWMHLTEKFDTIGLGDFFLAVHCREDRGWSIGNRQKPPKFQPSDEFQSKTFEITAGVAFASIDGLSPVDDEELQSFVLEFMTEEQRAGVLRKINRPEVDPNFWREWTSEPDWK